MNWVNADNSDPLADIEAAYELVTKNTGYIPRKMRVYYALNDTVDVGYVHGQLHANMCRMFNFIVVNPKDIDYLIEQLSIVDFVPISQFRPIPQLAEIILAQIKDDFIRDIFLTYFPDVKLGRELEWGDVYTEENMK